jgi:large subunit ribosomal protein L31
MKPDIHPKYNNVLFVDGEHEIRTRSSLSAKERRVIDGVEYHVVPIEISAYTHPFFTGKQKLMDSEGRVDRFNKRYNMADLLAAKKTKK